MEKRKRVNGNPTARQYYAAKYNGSNGDLIVGRVKSVRSNGDVILTNLLTGNRSTKATKATKILLHRNHRITKKQADELVWIDKKIGKATARSQAVLMWEASKCPPVADKNLAAKERKRSERRGLILRLIQLNKELDSVAKKLARLEGPV